MPVAYEFRTTSKVNGKPSANVADLDDVQDKITKLALIARTALSATDGDRCTFLSLMLDQLDAAQADIDAMLSMRGAH